MIANLNQAIDISIKPLSKQLGEHDAEFTINVRDETWHCYSVSISHLDVLCYCTEGIATYLVDTYGDRATCELFDWECVQ